MASVALAIEKAASRSEKLWWDSHRKLLEDFEEVWEIIEENAGVASQRRQKELEQRLRDHRHWLLSLLLCFKPPNAASREALDGSKIVVGSNTFHITKELKETTIQISKHLDLDEIQSFCLLQKVLDDGSGEVDASVDDHSMLQNVTMVYFLERQCLLKCTRLLVALPSGASAGDFEESLSKMVKEFMQVGFEDIVLENLKSILSSTGAQRWNPISAQAWADEIALEQALLLDLIFSMYYNSLCVCNGTKWKGLLQTFQELVFETGSDKRQADAMVRLARTQALLILIWTFDLRALLIFVQAETAFSQGSHGFSLEDLQDVDTLVSSLDLTAAPEYSPLLLAWATFLCLVSSLPDQAMILDIEHAAYAQQAYKSGACSLLMEILRSELLENSDFQITGYKAAIKTLASACLAAYDFANQVESGIHGQLLEIITGAYHGQESLCMEFWDRDSVVDGPVRTSLYSLRKHVPYKMLRLLRLLKSLCWGSWSADCVYNFICKAFPITCVYHLRDEQVYGPTIHISSAVPVPHCPGLYIPAGVPGHVLRTYNSGLSLVHWECDHSSLVVLLVYMTQWFEDTAEEVIAVVGLLNQMLSSNQDLASSILDVDRSTAVTIARMDGRLDKALSLDVIGIVCSVARNIFQSSSDLEAIAECVNLLQKFVYCHPGKVMTNFERIGITRPASAVSSWKFADQSKYAKTEQNRGCYPVTRAVLDIVTTLLDKGVRAEYLTSFVLYATHNLLVNHGNWKYKQRHERWVISAKIFQMLRIVLASRAWYHDNLRNVVFEAISKDSIIQGVLLHIFTINAQSLEELCVNRHFNIKEIECLVQAICASLELIYAMVLHMLDEGSPKDSATVSAFCQSLFQNSSTTFVSVVASYFGYHRHKELQVLSVRVLGKLCEIGHRAKPQAVNVSSYISGFETRKLVRRTLEGILSEDQIFEEAALSHAVLDFLAIAVKCQAPMAELLLFPWDSSAADCVSEAKKTQRTTPASEVLDAMWKLLGSSLTLSKGYMEILSRVLLILSTLWQGGTEYWTAIQVLRDRKNFWDVLSSIIIRTLRPKKDSIPTQQEALFNSLCYSCQASIYQILVHDLFMHEHLLDSKSEREAGAPVIDSGVRKLIEDLGASGKLKSILGSYGNSEFQEVFVSRFKAEARTLIVGLLIKLLMGEDKGMNVSLVKRLCELSTQIMLHPSFRELSKQYAKRGYRHNGSLELLVMTDFYYNLQGELEGRRIPSTLFQQLSDSLAQMEIDKALVPVSKLHFAEDYAFIGDVRALRAAIGLDFWDQNCQVVSVKAAESVLFSAERARAITHVGATQLLAIHAFSDLLRMFSSQVSRARLKFTTVTTSIEEICSALERIAADNGLKEEQMLYSAKFLACQSKLFLDVVWQLVTCVPLSSPDRDCCRLFTRVTRTCFGCIKFILDFQHKEQSEAMKNFTACLLLNLEAMRSCRENAKYEDAFVDVTLVGLSFLPMICSMTEVKAYSCFSLAIVNALIRDFLASSTWLPLLQAHFPTKSVISRLVGEDTESQKSCGVIIRLCLYLSRFRGAAEMLLSADILHYLLLVNSKLRDGESSMGGEGPFSSGGSSSSQESLWGLSVATIATMMRTLGESETHRTMILESVVAYMKAEKSRFLSALCAPNVYIDSQGRKSSRRQRFQASSASLQETEYVAALLCELVRHRIDAVHFLRSDLVEVREMAVHLLAYIAREGLVRGAVTESISCPPVQRQEVLAHGRPSIMGSSSAWFLICATGSGRLPPASGGEIVASTASTQSEYSESIAIQVYKIATLLLHFLVTQARQAIQDLEEGRSTGFPELPAPEVLHALQDQALVVATEMLSGKGDKALEMNVLKTCSMILSILEKSLYLEACIFRIYGISPVSLRADDFARAFRGLLLVEGHSGLEASMSSLKEIAAFVYPDDKTIWTTNSPRRCKRNMICEDLLHSTSTSR